MKQIKDLSTEEIQRQIDNGVNLNDLFVNDMDKPFVMSRYKYVFHLLKCWNFLGIDGKLLWKGNKWFDRIHTFKDGFAIVSYYNKGYNFLKTDGTLLWKGDKWFDFCRMWRTITKNGKLI